MKMPSASVLLFTTAALISAPTFAQTTRSGPTTGAATTAPATYDRATSRDTVATPSERNPVLTDEGQARASKIIGSSVYNDRDEKVGTIDDLLIGKDNKPMTAVLSVGGFLGVGNKLVAVPYDHLRFGNTNAGSDNKVVLTGATKDSLKSMAEYHYTGPRKS
jgi:sporulation protein YlmC with PRC-barrel domain